MKKQKGVSKSYLFVISAVLIACGFLVPPSYNYYISADGVYGQWSDWSKCLKYCGDSYKGRFRNCIKENKGYGRPCDVIGSHMQSKQCNARPCPIDGGIGQWLKWEECDRKCKQGRIPRHRHCDNPKPQHFGIACEEALLQYKPCPITKECPVDGHWNTWENYSGCSKSCNGGIMTRKRSCKPPRFDGKECVGVALQTKPCNEKKSCTEPVDARFGPWGPFSECTKTCGGGTKSKKRPCTPPLHGGKNCASIGNAVDTQKCNDAPCPPRVLTLF